MTRILLRAFAGTTSVKIGNLFAINTWSGNGSSQVINTGLDITGGGAVWIKARSVAYDHSWQSVPPWTAGNNSVLYPNQQAGAQGYADYATALGSTSMTIGANNVVNQSGHTFASWTFKKSQRFFDCGVFTGTGSNRAVSHGLGVVPSLVLVKSRGGTTDWYVFHEDIRARGYPSNYVLLNTPSFFVSDATVFTATPPTPYEFYLGTHTGVNQSGVSYAWAAFAHDPSPSGVCVAGGYAGNGSSSGPTVTLGWEPQFVLIKSIGGSADWAMVDATRGFATALLSPNTSGVEASVPVLTATSTGFTITTADGRVNGSGGAYSYIAIRKP